MATIVVYGGGFQPFHVGHLSSYLQAKKAFPDAAFYVAASNDTKQRPIPFKDKQFLAQQAGVKDPMVETRNPINPVEILSQYNPAQDVYIIVRSERDPMPYTKKDGSPAYYQPYVPGEPMQPFGKHGYVFVSKKHTFMVGGQEIYSGTQVRNMYTSADDKGKLELIHELYPNSTQQQTIKQMLDKYLAAPAPTADIKTNAMSKLKQKKLAEQINKLRPYIKEGTVEQKKKFMSLVQQALNESRIMDRNARINAYYVSKVGNRHKVAENIPYYLLDKLVPLLTKKYAITMNDIEVRPTDKNQYRRSTHPEMADESISGFGKKPASAEKKADLGNEFYDPYVKRALDVAQKHYPGSKNKQEAFVKFVQRSLQHAQHDDVAQNAQLKKLEQEIASIKQALQQPQQGVAEMDGDGAGRDGSNRKRIGSYGTRDRDIPGPDVHLGPEHAMKRKDITKRATDVLSKEFDKSHKGVAESSENDTSVVIGKLYDIIDQQEAMIKNADYDRQVRYATIVKDRAETALNMIKTNPAAAVSAWKYFQNGEQGLTEDYLDEK